eukprot:SM000040S14851  [mRNA]  locus=s40:754270:767547:+ [translate_table: standard]
MSAAMAGDDDADDGRAASPSPRSEEESRLHPATLYQFRAGKMTMQGTTVHPDRRKGLVRIFKGEDELMRFQWLNRRTFVDEEDFIVYPDDATFEKVTETDDRVYLVSLRRSKRKLFLWMQEPDADQDEAVCRRVNKIFNIRYYDELEDDEDLESEANSVPAGVMPSSIPGAAGSGGDNRTWKPAVQLSELQSILSNLGQESQEPVASIQPYNPGPSLAEIIRPETLRPFLDYEDVRERLAPHLPESLRSQEAMDELMQSVQFQQQVETFSQVLRAGQLDLSQFGIDASKYGFSVSSFLQAIEDQATSTADAPAHQPFSEDLPLDSKAETSHQQSAERDAQQAEHRQSTEQQDKPGEDAEAGGEGLSRDAERKTQAFGSLLLSRQHSTVQDERCNDTDTASRLGKTENSGRSRRADDDGGGGGGGGGVGGGGAPERLTVNTAFAARLAHNHARADLHRLRELQRRGLAPDSEGEDSPSEDEDEDGLLPDETEAAIVDALAAIRARDPAIYRPDAQFFREEPEAGDEDGDVSEGGERQPRRRPQYLKDVLAQQLIENGDRAADDDEEQTGRPRLPTFAEEQEALRRAVIEAAPHDDVADGSAGHGDDGDGLLRLRRKSAEERLREEGDSAENPGSGEAAGRSISDRLEAYFGSAEQLDHGERFLKNFLLNKGWMERDRDRVPSYEDVIGEVDEEEEELEAQERFEARWNFRYEEAGAAQVAGHSRVVESSVRKKPEARKRARTAREERQQAAAAAAAEELKRLKNVKKRELEQRLLRIQEVAGAVGDSRLSAALGADALDEDFDPADYDRAMEVAFNEDYYEQRDEGLGVPDEEDGDGDLEKPDFAAEERLLLLAGIEPDVGKGRVADGVGKTTSVSGDGGTASNGPVRGFHAARDKQKRKLEGRPGDGEGITTQTGSNGSSRAAEELVQRERVALEKQLEEYYKARLDYEDLIGDLPTRFRYRAVAPNMYGLNAAAILVADDSELNQFVSVKKLAPYQTKEWQPKSKPPPALAGRPTGPPEFSAVVGKKARRKAQALDHHGSWSRPRGHRESGASTTKVAGGTSTVAANVPGNTAGSALESERAGVDDGRADSAANMSTEAAVTQRRRRKKPKKRKADSAGLSLRRLSSYGMEALPEANRPKAPPPTREGKQRRRRRRSREGTEDDRTQKVSQLQTTTSPLSVVLLDVLHGVRAKSGGPTRPQPAPLLAGRMAKQLTADRRRLELAFASRRRVAAASRRGLGAAGSIVARGSSVERRRRRGAGHSRSEKRRQSVHGGGRGGGGGDAVSRVCDLTGKRANNGYKVSFSKKRTKHLQQPNLQYRRLWWPEGNRFVRLRLCTKALKTPDAPPLRRRRRRHRLVSGGAVVDAGSRALCFPELQCTHWRRPPPWPPWPPPPPNLTVIAEMALLAAAEVAARARSPGAGGCERAAPSAGCGSSPPTPPAAEYASGGSACAAAAKYAGESCGTSAFDVEVSGFLSMTLATVLTLAAAPRAVAKQRPASVAQRGRRRRRRGGPGHDRAGGAVVVIADGQVTQGAEIIKPNVRKVRRISEGVIGGFAGATADAFTLFERLESRIEEHPGTALATLTRAAVELAKQWRTDKFLRRLDAVMIVADEQISLTITGNGDVLEPYDGVIGIGSGGPYALAAARALIDLPDMDAEAIARKAMGIAADTCIYTNHNFVMEKLSTSPKTAVTEAQSAAV